jgi:hypothetical protein
VHAIRRVARGRALARGVAMLERHLLDPLGEVDPALRIVQR